jgi:hypothetical protein
LQIAVRRYYQLTACSFYRVHIGNAEHRACAYQRIRQSLPQQGNAAQW